MRIVRIAAATGGMSARMLAVVLVEGDHNGAVVGLRPERRFHDVGDESSRDRVPARNQLVAGAIIAVGGNVRSRQAVHVVALVGNDMREIRYVARGKIALER